MKKVFLLVLFLSFVTANFSFAEDKEIGNSTITIERAITLSANECLANLKAKDDARNSFVCRVESVEKKSEWEYFLPISQASSRALAHTSGRLPESSMSYYGDVTLSFFTNGYEVRANMSFKDLSLEEAKEWIKTAFKSSNSDGEKVTLIIQYPITR